MPDTIANSSSITTTYVDAGTANANPNWRKSALAVVKRLAKKRETLTAPEVLDVLSKSDVHTHDLRAIGGVLVEARRLGFIQSAGLVRRNDKHAEKLWASPFRLRRHNILNPSNRKAVVADTPFQK